MRQHTRQKGFTLLEVLVSATIVAVLTIIGVVSYSSVNKRSRDVKRKSDIEQIRSALEMFRSDKGWYPQVSGATWVNASLLDSGGLLDEGGLVGGGYTPAIPTDPQDPSTQYWYVPTKYDGTTEKYYGYCLCGMLETLAGTNTCVVNDLPGQALLDASCNYSLKSP